MTPTRRDLMKIAAGIVPTVDQRIAAAEALEQPVSDSTVHDPARFADDAQELIGFHSEFTNDWIAAICPEHSADEAKAQRRLAELCPGAGAFGTEIENAVWHYQEAVFALALALYEAGVRHGAAYEHLRRSVVGELATCWPCRGVGMLMDGETCGECGGTGTVALKA